MDWVGYCELCHFQPIVSAEKEDQAVELAKKAHVKERGKACRGLIVAALPASGLIQTKAVA